MSARSILVVVLALAAIASIVRISFFSREASPQLPGARTEQPSAPSGSMADGGAEVDGGVARAEERSAAAPDDGAPSLEITVVDAAAVPVPGASVQVAWSVDGRKRGESEVITDARGMARVALFPRDSARERTRNSARLEAHLRATRGTATGWGTWVRMANREPQVRVVVRPARVIALRVEGPGGEPLADVDVGVADGLVRIDRIPADHRAVTDARGLARISVPGTSRFLGVDPITAVAASRFGYASKSASWPAEGDLELTLRYENGSGTALRVRFVDEAGRPAEVSGTLDWDTRTPEMQWSAGALPVRGPEAWIRGYEAGTTLALSLWETGRLVVEQEVTVLGGQGEQLVTMARGRAAPEVLVPLVSPAGVPVTEGTFRVYVRHTEDLSYGSTVDREPDAQGVLHVALASEAAGVLEVAAARKAGVLYRDGVERAMRPYRTTLGAPPDPDPVYGVQEFSRVAAGTRATLQPVTIDEPVHVYRGVVLDAAGAPVPSVDLRLAAAEAEGEPAEFGRLDVVSGPDGRFEFRAFEVLPEATWICGLADLGYCAPVRVGGPGQEIELRFAEAGVIAFDATLGAVASEPAGNAPEPRVGARVTVYRATPVTQPGQHALFRDRASGGRDAFGRWSRAAYTWRESEIDGLVPGRYDLKVFVGNNRVLALEGIEVRSGEVTRPPELQGVDLADGLVHARVRVLRDGAPVRGARVRFGLDAWRELLPHGCNPETDERGEAWFVIPRDVEIDLEVHAVDAAVWSESGVRLPIDVDLSPGTAFDVEVVGIGDLRERARGFTLAVHPFENGVAPESPIVDIGGARMVGHPQADVDPATGRATMPNRRPGRYRVWFCLVPTIERGGDGFRFVHLGDYEVSDPSPDRIPIRHVLTEGERAELAR